MKQFQSIRVDKQVAEGLDKLKAPGQSYNGLLQELLELAERAGFGRVADRLGLLKPTEGWPVPKDSEKGRWKKK